MCKKTIVSILYYIFILVLVSCSSPRSLWLKKYNQQLSRDNLWHNSYSVINKPLNGMVYLIDTVSIDNPKLIRDESNYYLINGNASEYIDKNGCNSKIKIIYNELLWRNLDDISQFSRFKESLYMPSFVKILPDSVFCGGRIKSYSFEEIPVFVIGLINVAFFNQNNSQIDCYDTPPKEIEYSPVIFSEDALNRYVKIAFPLFKKNSSNE